MSLIELLELLGLFSLLTFVGSLLAVPWLIGRMRSDYFVRHRQQVKARHRRHPILALVTIIVRNGLGSILFMAGIAMLLLPGQGLLTMFLGICVMDFPGKNRMINCIC